MNQMKPPMPQPSPGGAPPAGDTGQAMESMRSAFNPTDAAAMNKDLGPNPTIREVYAKMGVDVDGPISQLQNMLGKQVQNASMDKKMQAMAGTKPPPDPVAGMGGGNMPAGQPKPMKQGLEALMG